MLSPQIPTVQWGVLSQQALTIPQHRLRHNWRLHWCKTHRQKQLVHHLALTMAARAPRWSLHHGKDVFFFYYPYYKETVFDLKPGAACIGMRSARFSLHLNAKRKWALKASQAHTSALHLWDDSNKLQMQYRCTAAGMYGTGNRAGVAAMSEADPTA